MADETRCPVCGGPVAVVTAPGPETGYVQPCGHAIHPAQLHLADGSSEPDSDGCDDAARVSDGEMEDPTSPTAVEVAYAVGRSNLSCPLHVSRQCPRLQQTTTRIREIDPDTFPDRDWCCVCSPWLEVDSPDSVDRRIHDWLDDADPDLMDDPRERSD